MRLRSCVIRLVAEVQRRRKRESVRREIGCFSGGSVTKCLENV